MKLEPRIVLPHDKRDSSVRAQHSGRWSRMAGKRRQ
jgi:hypothetical protein